MNILGVSETIQNKAKEQKGGFFSMLLGTLGVSLLGNILAVRARNRAGEGIIKALDGNKKRQKQEKRDKIIKARWNFNAASSFN